MKIYRHGHSLVNVDGKVFPIGGSNTIEGDEVLDSIEMLDPATEEWKLLKTKLHFARKYHQAVAHKHFIYVFSGYCRGRTTKTIEKYNSITGKMIIFDVKLSIGRVGLALAKVDNDVYLIGGKISKTDATDVVEIFNLNTEELREGEKVPFRDFGFTACSF